MVKLSGERNELKGKENSVQKIKNKENQIKKLIEVTKSSPRKKLEVIARDIAPQKEAYISSPCTKVFR